MRDYKTIAAEWKAVREAQRKLSRDAVSILQMLTEDEALPPGLISEIKSHAEERLRAMQLEIGGHVLAEAPPGVITRKTRDLEGMLSILREDLNHLAALKEDLCRSCGISADAMSHDECLEYARQKIAELWLREQIDDPGFKNCNESSLSS